MGPRSTVTSVLVRGEKDTDREKENSEEKALGRQGIGTMCQQVSAPEVYLNTKD